MNSNTSHTACTDAHTLSAHHIALILCTTSKAQDYPDCVPKIIVSFHLSRAMSLAPHRRPNTSSSTFSSVPGLQRLLTSRIPCADPREPRSDGYTDPEPRTEVAQLGAMKYILRYFITQNRTPWYEATVAILRACIPFSVADARSRRQRTNTALLWENLQRRRRIQGCAGQG